MSLDHPLSKVSRESLIFDPGRQSFADARRPWDVRRVYSALSGRRKKDASQFIVQLPLLSRRALRLSFRIAQLLVLIATHARFPLLLPAPRGAAELGFLCRDIQYRGFASGLPDMPDMGRPVFGST